MCDVMVPAPVAVPTLPPTMLLFGIQNKSLIEGQECENGESQIHCQHIWCAAQGMAGTVCSEIKQLLRAQQMDSTEYLACFPS
jgi:hypothetical protein